MQGIFIMKFSRVLLVAGLFLGLSGCAMSPERAAGQSSSELCTAVMTLPSYNINRQVRLAELDRRNEDCSRYAAMAGARARSDAASDAAIMSIGQRYAAPPYVPSPPPPSSHTYMINGRVVNCTTGGTVTNCF